MENSPFLPHFENSELSGKKNQFIQYSSFPLHNQEPNKQWSSPTSHTESPHLPIALPRQPRSDLSFILACPSSSLLSLVHSLSQNSRPPSIMSMTVAPRLYVLIPLRQHGGSRKGELFLYIIIEYIHAWMISLANLMILRSFFFSTDVQGRRTEAEQEQEKARSSGRVLATAGTRCGRRLGD